MTVWAAAAAAASSPWTTVIGIITIIATAGVGVYTARSARSANRETAQLTSWREMVNELRTDVKRLREERDEDQKRHDEEIAECTRRIDELTVRVSAAEKRERDLITWARAVVILMRAAELPFPPPPRGIEDSNPSMRQVGG